MNKIIKISFISFLLTILCVTLNDLSGQTIYTHFGKNRVQYNDDFDDWWYYDTDHYTVFWYGKERNIAKSVILESQKCYEDIENILDFRLNRKVQIVVFSDIQDLNQTNIGIKENEDFKDAGTTKFYDNKFLIYYNGDHNLLSQQIKEGTATVFLQNIFGVLNYENIYKKLIFSDFPSWFTEGSVKYLSQNWDQKDEQLLRDIFINNKVKKLKFDKWNEKIPDLAGKSFLYFLEQNYGKSKISDLYYLVRISRDIKSSLSGITGKTYDEITDDWFDYFKNKYIGNKVKFGSDYPKKIFESRIDITDLVYFKNTNSLAYIINDHGLSKVYFRNLDSGNLRKLFKHGYYNDQQITDYRNPIIFSGESENFLGLIYEKRDKIIFRKINLKDFKHVEYIISPKYRKIYSADYFDKNSIIFTAEIDGVNDIFVYNYKKKQTERITENIWDEMDAKIVELNEEKGIIFSSNMKDTISGLSLLDSLPPMGMSDIFFINLENRKIKNLTSTNDINEIKPRVFNNEIYFSTDENGIYNIKKIDLTRKTGYISDMQNDIVNFCISNEYVFCISKELCDNSVFITDKTIIGTNNRKNTPDIKLQEQRNSESEKNTENQFIFEIDSGLLFQSKFSDDFLIKTIPSDVESGNVSPNPKQPSVTEDYKPFKSYRAIASRLRFSYSELITKMDNEILFEGLETYDERNSSFTPPYPGFLVKSIVKDMFDDYFFEGGLRFSTDFSSKEYFLVYEDLKHKLDWQYAFYRKYRSDYNFDRTIIIDKQKYITNLAQVQAKYSFDNFNSIKLISRLQSDRNVMAASDTFSLNFGNINEQRISIKAEYVFDNTSIFAINQMEGNRSKFFVEAYNKFNFDAKKLSDFKFSKGVMVVLGFDARQYYRLMKKTTLALRLAGQTSFGKEKNIYFLGGMENWYFSNESNLVSLPENDEYAYKILVANLRGFGYNARNGSTFLVMNNELRIPIFRYLFSDYISKAFFRDFQINLFCDVGLSWYGLSPFSESNPSNYYTVDVPPSIKLKLRYYSDPIIGGVGAGFRTTIFGYFLKFDYAWGIETRQLQKPAFYFTMGYDF